MAEYTLSYIISTKNRLPYLKILFNHLLPSLNPDEEVVVVDGNSTDGSKEYLQELYNDGKINQYISEPDHIQAHGWNKAMLLSRATIIKKLIDDDIPSLPAIRKCRDFMLQHSEVDICISDVINSGFDNLYKIRFDSRLQQYRQWKNGETKSFTFSDVTMLLRKSSISYLGLFDTQFKMMDWEYSLRVSYLKAGIAYYTGYNALAIYNAGSVTAAFTREQAEYEANIGKLKYDYAGDGTDINLFSRFKIWVGVTLHKLKANPEKVKEQVEMMAEQLPGVYDFYYQQLEDCNNKVEGQFIF